VVEVVEEQIKDQLQEVADLVVEEMELIQIQQEGQVQLILDQEEEGVDIMVLLEMVEQVEKELLY
jgi:hypothetical protein